MNKEGIVLYVKVQENRFGILMHEDTAPVVKGNQNVFFNGFGPAPKKGDRVKFEWNWDNEEEPKWRNIEGEVKILERGEETPKKETSQSQLPQAPKLETRDTRNETIKFMNECIQDAFTVLNNRTEDEKQYLAGSFSNLVDMLRRTRIMKEIGRTE